MSGYIVGTMSTKSGWETQSVPEALALHLTYWFASRRNQSKILDKVPSFYYLWQQYGANKDMLVEQARAKLKEYMSELFDDPAVSVAATDKTDAGSQYRLEIAVRVNSDGVFYDLARSVIITNEQYKVLDEERLNNVR